MVNVYYSHIGEDELKNIEEGFEEYEFEGKLNDLIDIINSKHPGFKNLLLNHGKKILSSARVYKNVEVEEDRILDGEETISVKDLNDEIFNSDNLLISIYDPKKFAKLLDSTLKSPNTKLDFIDPKRLEPLPLEFNLFLDDINGPVEEGINSFRRGESTLNELKLNLGEPISINVKDKEDIENLFDRKSSKVLPESLIKAIQRIWELQNFESKLYLHQEDCLFYILGKLKEPEKIPGESLLLAIPTGGGKTEAFLIPIISHIYEKKSLRLKDGFIPKNKISTIVTYPTKALANDQANRIVEILFELNKNSNPDQQITIGVLTGDTPRRGGWDLKRKSIVQVCPNCSSSNLDYLETDTKDGNKQYIKCKHCGNEINFIILTREDILAFPPDLLITNLDMINICLQSPHMRSLFKPDNLELDLMVFDEVHLCESVFGCHTGHLLRRLEATCGKKPLYIGVSATIGNAKELASLIFNVPQDEILYLNENDRPYLKNEIDHYRYHYILTPHKWKDPDRYAQVVTTTLNTVDVVGHAIRDPHFRKTIVFSNYRQDTDNLVKYLRDQEDRYFKIYRDEILQKLIFNQSINVTEKKIAESIGGWYEYLMDIGAIYTRLLEVGWHRGGLEQKERLRAVTKFSSSKKMIYEYSEEMPVDIMMATKTLELGIDIGDVTNVFNCSAPFTVNEYVQRAGRGGRKSDSTTLTVIDPTNPLDFYLKNHFQDYVVPQNREFEEAPIIITNESITISHIYARILEFVADTLLDNFNYNNDIKVEDFSNLSVEHNGELVDFKNDPEIFGEIIFERMFKEKIIFNTNNKETTALKLYNEWFNLEHEILDVKIIKRDEETIKGLLIDKCRELRDKINSEVLSLHDPLTGFKSVDKSLVPKMRGSGPVCNVKVIREQRADEIKDYVGRRRAMTNMPPGGFATQGANTFIVDSLVRDPNTEKRVRNLLLDGNNNSFNFFKQHFAEYFPTKATDLDLRTPQDIKVKYFPIRFYCPNCGKTYSKSTDDDRCTECPSELRQLTEIYLCEKCGEIFEPPVPKACINPHHLENMDKFMASIKRPGGPRPKYDEFKFSALPELHWQCEKCKTIFNFHQKWSIDLPQEFIKKPFKNLKIENPSDLAKIYQYRPEALIINKERYVQKGLNPARYSCDRCNKYNIKAKNVPTVRCSLLEYIINNKEIMEPEKLDIGQIRFKNVDIISLSREYTRRFYTRDSLEIKSSEMFPEYPNSFLANTYRTHAAYLSINSSLVDEFINTQKFCLDGDCEHCYRIKNVQDNEITKPNLELKDWEKDKKPDIRFKWCKTVQDHNCNDNSCSICSDFVRRDYLKYLLIHAIKHSLILAMPKYLGVNKNEIRGVIYPNGKEKPELAFLDVHEDGSGSIYLMKRNWKKIWDLSEELMKNAMEGQGTLLLPQFCERQNIDLCPVIGTSFYEFVRK